MQKIPANYHTHTFRCGHASGTDRDYVENAVRAGFSTLGFSDHSPMVYKTDHVSRVRMKLSQTQDYTDSLMQLKAEYRDRIDVQIGLEAEFFPDSFREYLAFIADYPIRYLILGQHFLWREEDGIFAFRPTEDEQLLTQYCKNILAGLDTGVFSYVAHPDLMNFVGSDRAYARVMRPFVRELKNYGVPLEINRLGLIDERHYPRRIFWEMAAEEGLKAVIGVDAHEPAALLDEEGVDACVRFAHSCGVEVVTDVDLDRLTKYSSNV